MAWTKPLMGWVKANVDAAIFQNQVRIGTCCTVRDSTSAMIMGRTMNIMGAYSVQEVETLNLKEALTWLKGSRLINASLRQIQHKA